MTDPIRTALDKARAVYCHADGECPCATPDDCSMNLRSDVPAKIIAAFLHALKDGDVLTLLKAERDPNHGWRDTLAEAVLAAVKEEPSSDT